ncbi:hypothetical protein GCM10010350_72950 [Streptomyces galilaeus]|nr:hypothetical protein GCM10010350_72950 [Streptomyces galilaeus]
MPVVVHDYIAVPLRLRLHTDRGTGRPGPDPVLQDAGLGEARFDLGAAGQDVGRRFVVGSEVTLAIDGSATQDDGVAVGIEAQQVW